jgi:hypothetical protein
MPELAMELLPSCREESGRSSSESLDSSPTLCAVQTDVRLTADPTRDPALNTRSELVRSSSQSL